MANEPVDLTEYPIIQGSDWILPIVFGPDDELAADDIFEADFREQPGGKPVGSISTPTGFVINMLTRTVELRLLTDVIAKWYAKAIKNGEIVVAEGTRNRTLYTDVVHLNAQRRSRLGSGLLSFKLTFRVGFTRDDG